MKKTQHNHHPRHLAAIFLWLLSIALILAVGLGLLCHHLTGRIRYVSDTDVPTLSQSELDAFLKETAFQNSTTFQPQLLKNSSPKTVNILLIGQDRREGETRARADAMILCTLCKDSSRFFMTSFLRDLYVQIPGYRNNRLNAAYAAGGMPLLKQTFQENFGIAIDGCIEVDFARFSRLIDQMGGITLQLRQDEADLLNEAQLGPVLHAGTQNLCGDQALAYARIRSLDSDGDFSRTNRQRTIIKALLNRCQDSSLQNTLNFLKAAMPMLGTDMSRMKLLSLAKEFIPAVSHMEITGQYIPVDGSYSYEYVQGMCVLMADLNANRQFLKAQFEEN